MPDARLSITSLVHTYTPAPTPLPAPVYVSTYSPQQHHPTTTPVHELSTVTGTTTTTTTTATLSLSPSPAPYPPPSPSTQVYSTSGNAQHHSFSGATPAPAITIAPQTTIVKTPRGKRHRCSYPGCGRDFTRLSNLKAHWRRHSGEQPYSCMHCGRKFKWRSSLKSHELGCVYELSVSAGHGDAYAYAYGGAGSGRNTARYTGPASKVSTPDPHFVPPRSPHTQPMSRHVHVGAGPRALDCIGAGGTQGAVSHKLGDAGVSTFSGIPVTSYGRLPALRLPHPQHLSRSDLVLQNGAHGNGVSAAVVRPAAPQPYSRTNPSA